MFWLGLGIGLVAGPIICKLAWRILFGPKQGGSW